MKLKLKTLKQNIYDLEVSDSDIAVLELKKQIEAKHSFEAISMKLLFNGLVLDDKETLSYYSIKDGCTLILMTSKIQKKNDKKQEEIKDNTEKKETKEDNKDSKISESNNNNNSTTNNNTNTQSQAEFPYKDQLQQLLDMGFAEQTCKDALTAANGSVPVAIEFLYSEIPANLLEQGQLLNNNNEEVDNLYSDEENDGHEGHEHNGNVEYVVDENAPQYLSSEMFEGINLQDPNALKNIASVIKVIINQDPSALTELLAEVEEISPEIIDFIRENDAQFKTYMTQPVTEEDFQLYQNLVGADSHDIQIDHNGNDNEEGDNGDLDEDPFAIITENFTEKDNECIANLVSLGFDRGDAIQAYIACDKNETNAANFLFQDKNN